MRIIDEVFLDCPFYGSRRLAVVLRNMGHEVNRKRVQRLMNKMGIEAVRPKRKTTIKGDAASKYPYLLENFDCRGSNEVWASDITYIPLKRGFMFLVAIIDWFSRYVISWELSNSLSTDFCLEALGKALEKGQPKIFNSDQGCQFTSKDFQTVLLDRGIKISMAGRGRCFDNIFVERLWWSVKHEDVYPKNYESVPDLFEGLAKYFRFFNERRYHQSLGYKVPASLFFNERG